VPFDEFRHGFEIGRVVERADEQQSRCAGWRHRLQRQPLEVDAVLDREDLRRRDEPEGELPIVVRDGDGWREELDRALLDGSHGARLEAPGPAICETARLVLGAREDRVFEIVQVQKHQRGHALEDRHDEGAVQDREGEALLANQSCHERAGAALPPAMQRFGAAKQPAQLGEQPPPRPRAGWDRMPGDAEFGGERLEVGAVPFVDHGRSEVHFVVRCQRLQQHPRTDAAAVVGRMRHVRAEDEDLAHAAPSQRRRGKV
jgi:hypothetical protein